MLIHGPNLNMLGKRDPEIYGSSSLSDIEAKFSQKFNDDFEVFCFQSNHEGNLIDLIHRAFNEDFYGLVINAGAFTHYAYAIRDALEIFQNKKVEIHISNIYEREEFRRTSVISEVVDHVIVGKGIDGYSFAADFIISG
jgi:3-dehydroquinate dehydratase-2